MIRVPKKIIINQFNNKIENKNNLQQDQAGLIRLKE